MAILGVTNRTENWKTALYFSPLMGVRAARLARCLLPDKEGAALQAGDVNLELFWYGMRDFFHPNEVTPDAETLSDIYSDLFPRLHDQIQNFRGSGQSEDLKFQELQDDNYDVATPYQRNRLAQNLLNTEVDIVLESPTHLFIGEAKHLSTFGASGRDVLTHQLIRQNVLAHILLKLYGDDRTVVPFVVGDDPAYLAKALQVQFMLKHGRMRAKNILTWSDIEALW